MSSEQEKTRKPRKDAIYSQEELAVINPFKDEYRQQTTREMRGNIIRQHVLNALFKYWTKVGKYPASPEESISRMKVSNYDFLISILTCILHLDTRSVGSE